MQTQSDGAHSLALGGKQGEGCIPLSQPSVGYQEPYSMDEL